jgi:hypothetical protein
MKLHEYMQSHPGEYCIAQSIQQIRRVEDLHPSWAEYDVDEYVVGVDGIGRTKTHLYAQHPCVHLLTYFSGKT